MNEQLKPIDTDKDIKDAENSDKIVTEFINKTYEDMKDMTIKGSLPVSIFNKYAKKFKLPMLTILNRWAPSKNNHLNILEDDLNKIITHIGKMQGTTMLQNLNKGLII